MENILTFTGGVVLGMIIYFLLPKRKSNSGNTHLIIFKLNEILAAVKSDTAAERNLVMENERLRKELEALLSGAKLPPEVQKKVDAIFAQSKLNYEQLAKGISDNQP